MKKMRRKRARLLSWLLAAALVLASPGSALAGTADGTDSGEIEGNGLRQIPADPEYDEETDTTEWSYVYFGSYPQSEVTDETLLARLKVAGYDENGDTELGGEKYRRLSKDQCTYSYWFGDGMYRYFKWEKLKWRVNRVDTKSNRLVLASDKGIDCQIFDRNTNLWADSSIRTWMNETFYHTAFDQEEQTAIISNQDKVEIPYWPWPQDYGLAAYEKGSISYQAQASDFAHIMGAYVDEAGRCSWWLRKPGGYSYHVKAVESTGAISIIGQNPGSNTLACVPMIYLDIKSGLWSLSEESLESGRWSWEEKPDGDETDGGETSGTGGNSSGNAQRIMPKNPVYDEKTDTTKWSYIYFGSYPQSEVTDEALLETLKSAGFDENGDTEIEGVKYHKLNGKDVTNHLMSQCMGDESRYYKYEKIKWRVLNIYGDRMNVMSDIGLDCQKFDEETNIWEDSVLRAWMNETFYNRAFTAEEKTDIIEISQDIGKVHIPAAAMVTEGGFPSHEKSSNSRKLNASDFSRQMGTSIDPHNHCNWWLRTPGIWPASAACVGANGDVFTQGNDVYHDMVACVPALYIDYKSDKWSLADEGDNNGKEPDKENTGNSGGDNNGGSGNDLGDGGRVLPKNPVNDPKTDTTTWSYIYFGSYPQSEVKDAELLKILEKAEYDENENTEIGRNKYQRIYQKDKYRYFKWERLKWRVLSVDDGKLNVVSDKAIDFPPSIDNNSWIKEIQDTRSAPHLWMNEVFCPSAFNEEERDALLMRCGGKVYILNTEDVRNWAYGFANSPRTEIAYGNSFRYEPSLTRRMMTSEYASVKRGGTGEPGYCNWLVEWNEFRYLETMSDVAEVRADGSIFLSNFMSYFVPALYIDIKSDLWSMTDQEINSGDTGNGSDSGNTGDSGNAGDSGNTGDDGSNTGDSGNTGDDGSNTDDTGNAGGNEDNGNTGGSEDSGNPDGSDAPDIPDASNTPHIPSSSQSNFTGGFVNADRPVSKEEKKTVPVLAVSTAIKTITIGRGESFRAEASVAPADATDKTLTFRASNQKVAVSGNGTVTGKQTGTSWLVISAKGNTRAKAARVQVQVKKAPKKITLNARQKSLKQGKTFKIKAKLPKGAASHKITFSSNKPSVAKVSANGKVFAVRKGSATITARTFNGKKAKMKIRVQ